MSEERFARGIVMSAALLLAGAACKPEPPDDDGGVGGSATGGTSAVGGTAAGGRAPACSGVTVASLPVMNTHCDTEGESRCEASGDRCVCQHGRWFCTTLCASTYPTEPAAGSACVEGAACNYPSGMSCTCSDSHWWCIGAGDCPADAPPTGAACNTLPGRQCDYPNQNPAFHLACVCSPSGSPSTVATWTCIQSGQCPTTQPTEGEACPAAFTTCGYGSHRCNCSAAGYPWLCGFGALWIPPMIPGWALGGSDTSCGDRLCSLDHIQTFACQNGLCAPTCRTGWLDVNRPASGADDGCETIDTANR